MPPFLSPMQAHSHSDYHQFSVARQHVLSPASVPQDSIDIATALPAETACALMQFQVKAPI
jgi:hypothetical protein